MTPTAEQQPKQQQPKKNIRIETPSNNIDGVLENNLDLGDSEFIDQMNKILQDKDKRFISKGQIEIWYIFNSARSKFIKDVKRFEEEFIRKINIRFNLNPGDINTRYAIYLWRENIKIDLACPIEGCTGIKKLIGLDFGISEACAKKDPQHKKYKDDIMVQKVKEKTLEKYGVANISMLEATKEKKKETFIKNYGVDNIFKTVEFKQDLKDKMQKEHQVDNISQVPAIKELKKEINFQKYGVDNYTKTPEYKKQTKETNLLNYGVEHPMQNKEHQDKVKKTNLEKYGVDNPGKVPEFNQKAKDTNITRYGVEHYPQSPMYKEQAKESNLIRYGTEFYTQSEQAKKDSLAKYGVEYYSQSLMYREQAKATNLEKYGTEFYMQSEQAKKDMNTVDYQIQELSSALAISEYNFLETYLRDNKSLDVKKFMLDFDCCDTSCYNVFKEHDIEYKGSNQSTAEYEIIDYIRSLIPDVRIIHGSRQIIKPKELDIYLPDFKLAIEYNGLMYHSQGSSEYGMFDTPDQNRDRHLEKTELCEALGIHLLHINEDEWVKNPLGWKSVIRNKLKINTVKIGARKTTARLIPRSPNNDDLVADFLNKNHLQGADAIGPIRYGLFLKKNGEEELQQIMTFSKARFTEADYELIRMCSKTGVSIQGGASKLMRAFEKQHQGILVSYANRRWSQGGIYRQLGFTLKNISGPNYYYFHSDNIFKLWHRASFQKHKLQKKLAWYDPKGTEQSNMFANGYRRIFDSGNYVFIKKIGP